MPGSTSAVTARRVLRAPERSLHDQQSFEDLVRKERVRSDRTGVELSMATLVLRQGARQDDPGLRHALESILARVRCLDEVGWMGKRTLGILLPATSAKGASQLVENLRRNDVTTHLRLGVWTIYTYPDSWPESPDRADERSSANSGGPCPPHGRAGDAGAVVSSEFGRTPAVLPLVDLLLVDVPWWKRAVDIAGSAGLLALLSPLMLAAALAIGLTSRGPIFYASWRSGLCGRPFRFFKFRTMYVGAERDKHKLSDRNEALGPVFKMSQDPRVTGVGRLLRRLSIDELPQLWNVLKGDMSLVGPRPPIPEETRLYTPWQRRRLEGRGGLTCIWQVSGRSNVQFEDWCRMDLRYLERLEHNSWWTDLGILLRTIPAVISCRGAR